MTIQAQIRPSSMSSTGLSDASVVTSEGAGMNVRDAADVFIEAGFDGLELLEQPFNPLAARQLFGFPVLA